MTKAVFSLEPSLDKTASVSVEGWINPLAILYSTEILNGVSYLCWKIKDTEHVFKIQNRIVFENHGLDFSEHFILTLKVFLKDYKVWEKEGFPEDWMKKYNQMYRKLIL
jgi:hypothetical protein